MLLQRTVQHDFVYQTIQLRHTTLCAERETAIRHARHAAMCAKRGLQNNPSHE
jgi:hypothetical protein